ncbi:MAG: Ig-like domain-containing protein [Caldilineales bacterium]
MKSAFTPFDRFVWLIMALLAALIGLVLLRGDRVGVRVLAISPAEGAQHVSSQQVLRITFDQPIDLGSVLAPLRIEPSVPGIAQWQDDVLLFRPNEPLAPDTEYTVTLAAGLRSTAGQTLRAPLTWRFRTGHPHVAYLVSSEDGLLQVMLLDPADATAAPRQLTHEALGVWDYAPAPNGSLIAYAAIRADGGRDLWAVEPDSGATRLLLACGEDACSGPVWNPDSRRLVYERRAVSELAQGQGLARLWWLDTANGETSPVFSDSQWLGYGASFSADGEWISHAAPHNQALMVVNLRDGRTLEIPSEMGEPAVWGPRDPLLLYVNIASGDSGYYPHVFQVNAESGRVVDLSSSDTAGDSAPAWSPDGRQVAWSRRTAQRPVAGQVWVTQPGQTEGRFLAEDNASQDNALRWSPDGRMLLVQRVALQGEYQSHIWLYDFAAAQWRQIAANGAWPTWLP